MSYWRISYNVFHFKQEILISENIANKILNAKLCISMCFLLLIIFLCVFLKYIIVNVLYQIFENIHFLWIQWEVNFVISLFLYAKEGFLATYLIFIETYKKFILINFWFKNYNLERFHFKITAIHCFSDSAIVKVLYQTLYAFLVAAEKKNHDIVNFLN